MADQHSLRVYRLRVRKLSNGHEHSRARQTCSVLYGLSSRSTCPYLRHGSAGDKKGATSSTAELATPDRGSKILVH